MRGSLSSACRKPGASDDLGRGAGCGRARHVRGPVRTTTTSICERPTRAAISGAACASELTMKNTAAPSASATVTAAMTMASSSIMNRSDLAPTWVANSNRSVHGKFHEFHDQIATPSIRYSCALHKRVNVVALPAPVTNWQPNNGDSITTLIWWRLDRDRAKRRLRP